MKHAYVAINIILILSVFAIISRSGCGNTVNQPANIIKKHYDVTKYVTDTQYIHKSLTIIKNGKDIYHDTTIYALVPYIDSILTQNVIKEYYAKNVLSDTIKVDSGYIYIKDTIQMNRILNRQLSIDMKYPIINRQTFYTEKQNIQVYLGVKGMVSQYGNFQNLGVGLMLKTKSDKMYGIGAGFDANKNINITGDIYIKL